MTSKHTPGPWVQDGYGNLKVSTTNGRDYVKFSGLCLSSGREADANTRLIAAAPELLKALITLERLDGQPLMHAEQARIDARAAIAKATGVSK